MKKRIEISLEYKLYEAIQKLCEYNGIEIEKYIEEAVADKYYIFKYGDLNEKIKEMLRDFWKSIRFTNICIIGGPRKKREKA